MNESRSYHTTSTDAFDVRRTSSNPAVDAEGIRRELEHLWKRPPAGPMPRQRHGSLRRRLGFWLMRLGRRVGRIPEPNRISPAQHYSHVHVAFNPPKENP